MPIRFSWLWNLQSRTHQADEKQRWTGWNHARYLFTFGDSYTSTFFNPRSPLQPRPSNPIGNPDYPGQTQTGTATYVDYLTTRYNHSYIELYNLAQGGATIDGNILADRSPFENDFRKQVLHDFVPLYNNSISGESSARNGKNDSSEDTAAKVQKPNWNPADTLFLVFFGVNDCVLLSNIEDHAASEANTTAVLKSYRDRLEDLHKQGARSFLLLNVPPLHRTPPALMPKLHYQRYVPYFNAQLRTLVYDDFRAKHSEPDTRVWLLDVYELFNGVLDDTGEWGAMRRLRNLTDECGKYHYTTDPNYFDPTCGVPLSDHFWADTLHVTSTVHDLLAERIVALLDGEE
ncbi:MAG: hypothetical protein M1831_001712 [Alyxoria varia]|nr:MAG: hypothetical protein M1831_001712 [Alyxoria varia]